MGNDSSFPQAGPVGQPWQEIDDVVEGIARLSTSEMSEAEFYAELLDRIVPSLAAVGAALWTDGPKTGLRLRYQIHFDQARLAEDPQAERRHGQLLERVLRTGKPKVVPPKSGPADQQAANPTEFVLVLCPWRLEDESSGVVELIQRPGASPAAERGYLRLLAVVCELVTDFHRNRQLRSFKERMQQYGRFEQYSKQVHGSLDLRTTAFRVANEGRRLIGCDRVSVAVRYGSNCRVLAISGADSVHRRANTVRQLERLSAAVAAAGEPLWHPGDDELPSAIERPLSAYLDTSHARGLAVVPLGAPEEDRRTAGPEVIGVLVAEQFQGVLDDGMRARVSASLGHGALALRNALAMHRVPLGRPLRAIGKLFHARHLPKTAPALLLVAAAAISLIAVQADFHIKARGELQPLARRDVFAPSDGVVSQVHVAHGEQVPAGKLLVEMRSSALDFEFKRVWGELQTARTRLAAVKAERLETSRETAQQRRRHAQFTAEQEELKELISGLEKQYGILKQQQSELRIRSPTDPKLRRWEVLTWDLKSLLEARPVTRGQTLMTLADLQGPWTLELKVPDDRIAHVLAARQEMGERLDVSFVSATDPGIELRGVVKQLGVRTEIDESAEAFVRATVDIDRDEIPVLVPGATVVAKIHCGRRSIGYVWFHDLAEAVKLWVLF